MENQEVVKGIKPAAKSSPSVEIANGDSRIVVVDMGKKQSGKKIRQLQKGHGALLDQVKAIVEDTKENLSLKDAVPIVIVVRKKDKSRWW